ncbi:MAG: family 20 glycosylhydrolase [Prevotella sp.]|nr:family 20 glycosylhydrolase [Prevotella sp.]
MRIKSTILLLLLAVCSVRAAGFPTLSEGGNEYWYYLKFTQGVYVVASNGDGVVCKSAIPTGKAAQLWKVEGSAANGYTFTNKLGLQLYAKATSQGSEICASKSPGSLNKFKINTRGSNYTITPFSNTGQAFNCWGGMGFKHDVKLYDSGDANAPMAFLTESEGKVENTLVSMIPYPLSVSQKEGRFDLRELKAIVFNGESNQPIAQRLADDLQRTAGISCQVLDGAKNTPSEKHLSLAIDASRPSEGYQLSVGDGGIQVRASDFGGFFNALQSLRQMMPVAIYGKTLKSSEDWTIPQVDITDKPLMSYRGFMLDVSRHFFDKDEVKKLLDVAAIYKLNRFHWHLTDDQGWRIEIPEYPKLTTVGAIRSGSMQSYDPTNGTTLYDDTEYGRGCFYTLDDLREIVAYAKERNIEIIPEIDMPGHMVAAVTAYPELSCDPSKTYSVRIPGGISTDVLNIGKDETIDFLKCVLGHIAEVFPYDYIHIGGDECPTTAWQNNADCQRRIQEEGLGNVNGLQPWLVQVIGSFLQENYGKKVMAWDEVIDHWNSSYSVDPLIMAWHDGRAAASANKGFKSVFVPSPRYYLDQLQITPSQLEIDAPYMGGYGDGYITSVEGIYGFNPHGEVSGREHFVVGTQVNLWTETCTSNREAEYCFFPRLLALSEVAWRSASQRSFPSFYTRLQSQDEVLDEKEIFYAKHYFEPADLTPAEEAMAEAEDLLEKSVPGTVGYPDQSAYNALQQALDALKGDVDNSSKLTALQNQLQAYKAAPIILPEEGKFYKITSAATFFRTRFNGSSLYAKGDNGVYVHYTPQTEPEELWQFIPQANGSYKMSNICTEKMLTMPASANGEVKTAQTGTNFTIRKATKPAGGHTYIPGVVNIKNGRYNLYARLSGSNITIVANTDSTLCYPGTWRIEEVDDYTLLMQKLVEKGELICETAKPGQIDQPTESALQFLSEKIVEPGREALSQQPVSRETYLKFVAFYEEFRKMPKAKIEDTIDEGFYYQIQNAYFTDKYACANASSNIVEPKNYADNDGFKWMFSKNADGTFFITSKLTSTGAYVSSNAADQQVRLGQNYKWTLRQVTTDQGNTAIAITDGTKAFSWYTNPGVWNYVLLKPYDWGASVWNLIKTNEDTPSGITSVTTGASDNGCYDLMGRKYQSETNLPKGIYVKGNKKIVK